MGFPFPDFTFRDPQDVFKEFFGSTVFNIFESGKIILLPSRVIFMCYVDFIHFFSLSGKLKIIRCSKKKRTNKKRYLNDQFVDVSGGIAPRGSRNRQNTQISSLFDHFTGMNAFNMSSDFNEMFSPMNGNSQFSSFTTSSTFGENGGNGAGTVKKTSTSTRFINGKKVTTKK